MAFRLPTFPLFCNIWRNGSGPPAIPDVVSECQLTPGRREITAFVTSSSPTDSPANMFILLPPATDIRDAKAPAGPDVCECPQGSGRLYDVAFVDDVGCGFDNEHRFAILAGIPTWPVPFPVDGIPGNLVATPIGTLTSGGTVVQSLAGGFTLPAAGHLLVNVGAWNQAAAVAADWNGVNLPSVPCGAGTTYLGNTSYPWQFLGTAPAGSGTLTVQFPAATTGCLEAQVILLENAIGTVDVNVNATGGGSAPAVGAAGPSLVGREYWIGFALIFAIAGGTSPTTPYTQTGLDLHSAIGGNAITLASVYYFPGIIGSFPTGFFAAFSNSWAMELHSFR